MPCGVYRTFLDTNIIWYADWLGPYIFDRDEAVLSSGEFTRASPRRRREWFALAELFRWALHVNPVFIVSQTVVDELREDRHPFGVAMYEWVVNQDEYSLQVPANEADFRLLSAIPDHSIIDFVPDRNDRRLLAEAPFYACDSFLTMDERTIWRFRQRIQEQRGIRVLRPTEMFSSVFRLDKQASAWISRH
jgi:hypothetical protein